MKQVAMKDIGTLVGKRIKVVSSGVVYEGRLVSVEPDFVHIDAGIRDVRMIRLDRRILGNFGETGELHGKFDNQFLYVEETVQ